MEEMPCDILGCRSRPLGKIFFIIVSFFGLTILMRAQCSECICLIFKIRNTLYSLYHSKCIGNTLNPHSSDAGSIPPVRFHY